MNATHSYPTADIAKPETRRFAAKCSRCGGAGYAEQWRHTGGVCFRCGGNGQEPNGEKRWVVPASWTAEQVQAWEQKREDARNKRAAKKVDKRQAMMNKNCAAHPAVAALRASWLADDETDEAKLWYAVSNVATDIMWKAFDYTLSEKQVALIATQVERATEYLAGKATKDAERAAEKANAVLPVGRKVAIAGTVVSRKWHDNDFGSVCKLTVKLADGACVWFTEPKNLSVAVGDEVAGTLGEIVASEKDATFGFGKRPTGFVVTKENEEARA